MIFFYGTNSVSMGQEAQAQAPCPNCGEADTTVFARFVTYFHFFWIPVIPFRRYGGSVCTNCETEFKPKRMDGMLKESWERYKLTTRIPFWTFSGLGIIALLAIYISYTSYSNDQELAAFYESPQPGDLYDYKTEGGNYSSFKLTAIAGDSVFLMFNLYETDRITGLLKMRAESDYEVLSYPFHHSLIDSLWQQEAIVDIHRE